MALNVHTIHAETEGMGQLETFVALVRALKDRGARFIALRQAAAALDRTSLPVCEVVRTSCPDAPDGSPHRARRSPTAVAAAPASTGL